MEELSQLIDRFLRHLGFAMPTYEACSLANISVANKTTSDFIVHMKSNEDVAYGALLLLQRFKDIPHQKSRTQDGHKYFMAAYSLSATFLLVTEKSAFIRVETQSFTLRRSLFPWIDIETARLNIIDGLRGNLTFEDKLPLFKSVIQRDFRSDDNQHFPQYPRSLVTNHPHFLTSANSRYIPSSDIHQRRWSDDEATTIQ